MGQTSFKAIKKLLFFCFFGRITFILVTKSQPQLSAASHSNRSKFIYARARVSVQWFYSHGVLALITLTCLSVFYNGRSQTRWTLPAVGSPILAFDCSLIDTLMEESTVAGKGREGENKKRREGGGEMRGGVKGEGEKAAHQCLCSLLSSANCRATPRKSLQSSFYLGGQGHWSHWRRRRQVFIMPPPHCVSLHKSKKGV